MSILLSVHLDQNSVSAMKAHLTRALPGVKSSHRCEGLARGLGYRTYAALIAASDDTVAHANGQAFAVYMARHGFECHVSQLYGAMASAAMHQVAEREPRLTAWGIGIGEHQRESDGRWETMSAYRQRLAEARRQLTDDRSIPAFLLSSALLQRVTRTTTVRSGTGSYKLKHIAENYSATYPGGEPLGPVYVSNGILIAAALHAGFTFRTHLQESGIEGINVTFNMSKRAIDDLDCEIRPDAALAQSRERKKEMRQFKPLFRYLGMMRSA